MVKTKVVGLLTTLGARYEIDIEVGCTVAKFEVDKRTFLVGL